MFENCRFRGSVNKIPLSVCAFLESGVFALIHFETPLSPKAYSLYKKVRPHDD